MTKNTLHEITKGKKQQMRRGSRLELFLTVLFFYLSLWLLAVAFLPQIPTQYHLAIKTVQALYAY